MSEERDDIAELVENLRDMAPPRSAPFPDIAHIYEVAADVIEELQKELASSREWEEKYKGDLDVMCRWHEEETARADASQARLSEAVKVLEEAAMYLDGYPEYHDSGMGCGLEDRNITDRYEAMRHGWDSAMDRTYIEHVNPAYEAIKAFLATLGEENE